MVKQEADEDVATLTNALKAFDLDRPTLEEQILRVQDEVTKSYHVVTNLVATKYQKLVPHLRAQNAEAARAKIENALREGRGKIQSIEQRIEQAETKYKEAMEDVPRQKLAIIAGINQKLSLLSEIDRLLTRLVDDPQSDEGPLQLVQTIKQLEKLCEEIAYSSDEAEAVDDRILPSIREELDLRRSEATLTLSDFYRELIDFPDVAETQPGIVEMVIAVPDASRASENLAAMSLLNLLDSKVSRTADAIWKMFAMPLVYGTQPAKAITYRDKESEESRRVTFSTKSTYPKAHKVLPEAVVESLTEFFERIRDAMADLQVSGAPFVTILGSKLAARLVDALVKDCLTPAIPHDKDDASHKKLADLATTFHRRMKELRFFTDSSPTFEHFIANYDRIFVDRCCYRFVKVARDLVLEPYIDLVEVGGIEDEDDKPNVSFEEAVKRVQSQKADKLSPALFKFQPCQISAPIKKLTDLVAEIVNASLEAETEIATKRLLVTAQNVVKIFLLVAPRHHQQALTTVPQIAAVYFNNCHYLSHRLASMESEIKTKTGKKFRISKSDCSFEDHITELRNSASSMLEVHITNAKRQLSATIGDDDVFVGLSDANNVTKCTRMVNSCAMQLEQIANVWRPVMTECVFAYCVGKLVSHLLDMLADVVFAKEDIAAKDSDVMVEVFENLQHRLEKVMQIGSEPTIQRVCAESYYRMQEVIFCLNASLADIADRWCEGMGPLATYLEPQRLKGLIRALFQNTDRRAAVLAQIQ
ncbi:Centromere/kinetochore Zw10 family protein [Aphelenchoides avenae]|nr:Centromere/kinetochore Zw10 family protein [Aphelenchus avenae]